MNRKRPLGQSSRPAPGSGVGTPGPVGRASLLRVAMLALLGLAAPTAGDIGSCAQPIEELDPAKFFAEKNRTDCGRCVECGLVTGRCTQACGALGESEFSEGCYPLAQDGEVCLGALRAASCDDFATYVADAGAETPTECNFCPPEERPGGG